jgi:hypothetical protein
VTRLQREVRLVFAHRAFDVAGSGALRRGGAQRGDAVCDRLSQRRIRGDEREKRGGEGSAAQLFFPARLSRSA